MTQRAKSSKRPARRLLFFLHDVEKSGAPRATVNLAAALARRGWPTTLCIPCRGGLENDAHAAGLDIELVPNPPVSLAGARGAQRLRLAAARAGAVMAARRVASHPDVAAAWIGSSVALPYGLGVRLAGKRVVFHIHEDLAPTTANRVRVGMVKALSAGLTFDANKATEAFLPRPPGQPWVVLPNLIDQETILATRRDEALRASLSAKADDVVFFTAAFLSHRKGIDMLVEAFALVARVHGNARLWIAGGEAASNADFVRGVKQRVAAEGLADRVQFLGMRDDVPALLAAADVFVLASRNEAFPLSIAEAMMARRAVIATDVGSVADMVKPGRNGQLVPPGEAIPLAEAMARYAADSPLREKHARAGHAFARAKFDQDVIADAAERFLAKLGVER